MRGAVIDMDGTLLDSMNLWERIDREFLWNRRGIAVPPDYMNAIAAFGFRETALYTIARFNLPDTPEELMAEWEAMAVHEYTFNIALKPHAKEFLEQMKKNGVKTVLCTSSPESFYAPALKRLEIYSMFDAFVTTGEVGRSKRYPDVYLEAVRRLGLAPGECVAFEDIPEAVCGAKAAGLKVCGVYDEASAGEADRMKRLCDRYIMNLGEFFPYEG